MITPKENVYFSVEGASGNLGWAYYKVGDSERSLKLILEAEKNAVELGSVMDQVRWLVTSGYVYLDNNQFSTAEDNYKKALDLARKIDSKEDILNAVLSLAFVTVQTGELEQAKKYSEEAIAMAHADGNRNDELYPLLVRGQIAARQHDPTLAEKTFLEVSSDPKVDPSLQWEAQHELANLYVEYHRPADADKTYRAALATFERARASLHHEDSKLPFLANAQALYDDYLNFLITQGKPDRAFQLADYSRAQTLAEGLRIQQKLKQATPSNSVNPAQAARQSNATILFYWLGAKKSYLWAVTSSQTRLFSLPPASEINDAVQRYRKALVGPRDVLETANPDGSYLYQTLVAPAQKLIPRNSRVVVVPDGSLNNLNFETLLAPAPQPHYWIEDVTIANANSLRMLAASQKPTKIAGKLLLIGDAVSTSREYPELPNASVEMANIEKHFAPASEKIYSRAQATPSSYLESQPGQFSYIHFVAHGTASRLSPLDSAVVLSKSSAEEDSFKLHARDIIGRPLRADLVTISTCYGSGERAYTGEGLVGLSWAFLRAGAHNVIGALWEVSDTSTPQLMDQLYAELKKGRSPDAALRAAKLSLLHSGGVFRKPFYWAPFQLYTGS